MSTEYFELVDEDGNVIGKATRQECHNNPALLHQVVHIFVWNTKGELVLQFRPPHKDIQPNKWDTSVGGHVDPGETPIIAAHRELQEELGIQAELIFLYRYVWRCERESELVSTYMCTTDTPLSPHPTELADIKWWSPQEINTALGTGLLTENFELEWKQYNEHMSSPSS
ncbi:MAG TPA: hypothetical protein DCE42_08020 [Myxococcales bacterium]|nr:hypothetical protein [Deltaproteobacteria bacterium]HAA54690.1 hypothetical protein [Myxococcales bacterium]|tara:strand:+ start:1068 stop:1577 length:510 start_codon:yes stop_codon:yes gene_type:complete